MAVTTAGPTVATDAAGTELRPRSSAWVVQVTALSLLLGCFLGLALQAQKSIRAAQLPASRFGTLVPFYEALKDSNQNLQQEVKDLRQKIFSYETRMAAGSDMEQTLQKKLAELQMLSGLTAVEGPGLVIRLRDAPKHVVEEVIERARTGAGGMFAQENLIIHDTDLGAVLSELKAAGAEALAISGVDTTRPQRIVANSTPRCSGPNIRVNDALISGPYTIWAIGNPAELEGALRIPEGLIDKMGLSALEMITIEKREMIKIPAYSSSIKFTYAKPAAAAKPADLQ
jgi:uncharacterized protein YlxW (UPF0749 family)